MLLAHGLQMALRLVTSLLQASDCELAALQLSLGLFQSRVQGSLRLLGFGKCLLSRSQLR